MDACQAPGGVLLVSTYTLGQQPLALARSAAHLVAAGFQPAVCDLAVSELEEAALARARLVAIHVEMHTALRLGLAVAARVRAANAAAHVCFYGVYAALHAEQLFADGLADSILPPEADEDLVALARGESAPTARRPGEAPRPVPRRRDRLLPDRSQLPPLESYVHLDDGSSLRAVGYVEASRGCKHRCTHCPLPAVWDGRFVAVERDLVLEDIARLVASGATHVTFGDPDFLNGPTHAIELARALHRAHPRLTFDFTAKIEHLAKHADMLPELRASGCLFIVSAAESFSDRVLDALAKGHTYADFQEVLARVRAAGIRLRPTFVPFTPWASLDDYLFLLDEAARLGLVGDVDPVQWSIRLLVPPGSLLLASPDFASYRGELDAHALTHTWRHPDPRMDTLAREVARVAAEALAERIAPHETFATIRTLGYQAAGRGEIGRLAVPASTGPSPRLTESWFC
jgi:radical SAM superfamily enzyme YgiQ (UPF0313 family)